MTTATMPGSNSFGACRNCTTGNFGRRTSLERSALPVPRLCNSCRWSALGRIRFWARVRAVVFLRARMSAARVPPVQGRALSRRAALRPSPAPACAAGCLAKAPAGFERRMTGSRVLVGRGKKPALSFPHVRPPPSYPFIRPRQAFLCQVVSCHEVSLGWSHRQEHA